MVFWGLTASISDENMTYFLIARFIELQLHSFAFDWQFSKPDIDPYKDILCT